MEVKTVNLDTIVANRSLAEDQKKDTSVLEAEPAEEVVEEPVVEEEPAVEEEVVEEVVEEEPAEEVAPEEEPAAEEPVTKVTKLEKEKVVEKPVTLDSEVDDNGKKVPIKTLIGERNSLKAKVDKIESNEFLKKLIAHMDADGNPRDFIESQSINWDKETDLDVIRRDFEKKNPDVSPALKPLALKKHLLKTYGIDPFNIGEEDQSTDDFKLTQDQIRRDAKTARESFKAEQKKFSIPEPVNTAQVRQKQAEDFKAMVLADKDVNAFKTSKMLKLGFAAEDGSAYGYAIDNPDAVVEMATSEGKFWKQFVDDSGKIDWNRLNKSIAYSQDPDAFEKQIFEWGKREGERNKVKENRNIDGKLNKQVVAATGEKDAKKELLNAFLKQKKK